MSTGKVIENGLPSGTRLRGHSNDYQLVRSLGQGAFGITYLAEMRSRNAYGSADVIVYVAVKEFFMHEINGRRDTFVTSGSKQGLYDKYKKKFINEAKNLSKLKHDNIIKVIETFEANNTVYYSMEFIDGGSLDEYIAQKGKLSENETLRLAAQIVEALSFMHTQKMLHLDLKPSNIMMRDGEVVLIDFGLSKQFDDDGNPESSTTIGGGTPGYAPVEQMNFNGDYKNSVPVTMDIYALGATMFKMLLGHKPPVASDLLNDGFPVNELKDGGVSAKVIRLIQQAMEPLKKDRIQNAASFQMELKKASKVSDNRQRKLRRWILILITALLSAIIMLCKQIFQVDHELPEIETVQLETSVTDYRYENSKGLSYTYTGDIDSQRVPHGKGKGIYANGTYDGDYSHGLRHGEGKFDTKDGQNHYVGIFKDDLYHEGTLTLSNGMYYEGTFNDGQPYNGIWYNKDKSVNCNIKNGK